MVARDFEDGRLPATSPGSNVNLCQSNCIVAPLVDRAVLSPIGSAYGHRCRWGLGHPGLPAGYPFFSSMFSGIALGCRAGPTTDVSPKLIVHVGRGGKVNAAHFPAPASGYDHVFRERHRSP